MHIPTATYRIQFTPSFGFKNAKEILDYLKNLGISDIYASPIFKAKKGSTHGYDVTDPGKLNPELGQGKDFDELHSLLEKKRLFWLQDIVPNHMAFDSENKMLMDVLENGEKSPFHRFFDIKWDHPYEIMRGRVLVPFLGKFYSESLESGDISLTYDQNGLAIKHYDLELPINLASYDRVLLHNVESLENELGSNNEDLINYLGFVHSLKQSGDRNTGDDFDLAGHSKKMIREIYEKDQKVRKFIDGNLDHFNGRNSSATKHLLDELLSDQPYRLSFWKVASEEINYRRFFSINALISIRVEDQEVFEATHELVFRLVSENKIHGLRIDHIDGLYDPGQYLRRLKERVGDKYITVEKILAPYEDLPSSWPVGATTGYDFLNIVNGIFVYGKNASDLTKVYYRFNSNNVQYEDLLCEKKRLIMGKHMAGDIDNLAQLLKKISAQDIYGRDITLYGLKRALVEMMSHFPVYRTYISSEDYSAKDQDYIESSIERAKEGSPGLKYELDFIKKFFSLGGDITENEKNSRLKFIMRFQQFTGPLMAKGLEDTTLYIYNRLISLNDVGGSPEIFGVSLPDFHNFNVKRALKYRYAMNATSTHDTKRGEDVRARINVLSEIPKEWSLSLSLWSKMNRNRKKMLNGRAAPDKNDEYFIYQTLLGSYPFDQAEKGAFVQRMQEYLVKAIREAKVHTEWIQPDIAYEGACKKFIESILKASETNKFLESFILFQEKIAYFGIYNSLSQALIKITSPGFPDLYQGSEFWDLNLVDPDNRRPVDYEKRVTCLSKIEDDFKRDPKGLISELLSCREDGRIKMFLIWRSLNHRNQNSIVFENGEYVPLQCRGKFKENIVSFARTYEDHFDIIIAPRFLTDVIGMNENPLGDVWEDTVLLLPEVNGKEFKDIYTNENVFIKGELRIKDVLRAFPNALLTGSA